MITFKVLLTLSIALNSPTSFAHSWELIGANIESFKALSLNETCTDNSTCSSIPNSFCDESTEAERKCSCLPNHISFTSTKENCDLSLPTKPAAEENEVEACLPLIDWFDERCTVNEQCIQGSFGALSHCLDGYCRCLPNATYHDYYFLAKGKQLNNLQEITTHRLFGYCTLLAENLGDSCNLNYDQECRNIPFSQCSLDESPKTCSCQPGTVASLTEPNTCIQLTAKIGGSCETHQNCKALSNTKCEEENGPLVKTCQCESDSFVRADLNDGCVEKVDFLNASCTVGEQCSVENSACRGERPGEPKTCSCVPNFVQSILTPNECLKIGSIVGAECKENIQCQSGLGPHSECRDDSCHCKDNGISYHGQCYPRRLLGEQCQLSAQCASSTEMMSLVCELDNAVETESIFRCQCPPESHREYNGTCYPISGYGESCESNEQCWAGSSSGPDSYFICNSRRNNTCDCQSRYMLNSDETKCIPKAVALGEECQESRQCSTSIENRNQFCNNENPRTCQCKAGYRKWTGFLCTKIVATTTTTTTTPDPDTSSTESTSSSSSTTAYTGTTSTTTDNTISSGISFVTDGIGWTKFILLVVTLTLTVTHNTSFM